jgi:hypothetical protein
MYYFEQILYEASPEPSATQASKPQTSPKSQKVQKSSTPQTSTQPSAPPPVPPMSAAQAKQMQEQPLTPEQKQAQAEAHAEHASAVAKQTAIQAQQAQSLAQKGQELIPDDFDFSEDDLDEDGDQNNMNGDVSQDPDSTLIPIKRYYLIQKLFALNDKLNELRIRNDILSLVISFVDSFSYQSLLALTNKFVEEIYLQVSDKSGENKDNNNKNGVSK